MDFFEFLYFGLMGFFGFAALSVLIIIFIVSSFLFVLGVILLVTIKAFAKEEMADLEKEPIEIEKKAEPKREMDRYLKLMVIAGFGLFVAVALGSGIAWMFIGILAALLILFAEHSEEE